MKVVDNVHFEIRYERFILAPDIAISRRVANGGFPLLLDEMDLELSPALRR